MNKQPEITDATRNKFIQVFCDLCESKALENITVKEIAEKAGYSRTTFYNYFKDPYDLLDYIEQEFLSPVFRSVADIARQGSLFEKFVYTFVHTVSNHPSHINTFIKGVNSAVFCTHIKEKALPFFMDTFQISCDNFRGKYAVEFYLSGIISLLCSWIKEPQSTSMEELAAIVQGILQDGIIKQLQQ